ncbi:MAG: hypothetical protein QOG62_253 [Thermoleophilaceae bacterium]|nr:hypothetical protein [Thermoleophilaceae bacterium]
MGVALLCAVSAAPASAVGGCCYRVGVSSRAINPDADGTFDGKPVYLGGYGIGSVRPATGVLGKGLHVRAIAISGGGGAIAIADIESQGMFAAYKEGRLGLEDMRKAVAARTKGALEPSDVIIQTDHSHSGPDGLGVWGGVPTAYKQMVFDRTVSAIVRAYESRRPGRLRYGAVHSAPLLSNQFSYDKVNQGLDDEMRVLQAIDDRGKTFASLVNFSAHATVLGSDNTLASGDWPQAANPMLEKELGGKVVTMVGTLGRTQPRDHDCPEASLEGARRDLCRIRDYASRVVKRAALAASRAEPVKGKPLVTARSYLIHDLAVSPLILGLDYVGDPLGTPVSRSLSPPWLTLDILGTLTSSARVGDVLISAVPGEAYPQIAAKVRRLVPAQGYMTAGLADDQLGYLIAPYEAYPEPIRRSFFNERGDEVSPIDNDNFFFNVSPTMGERVTCSLLRGAGEVFGAGQEYRDAYDRCSQFSNDLQN